MVLASSSSAAAGRDLSLSSTKPTAESLLAVSRLPVPRLGVPWLPVPRLPVSPHQREVAGLVSLTIRVAREQTWRGVTEHSSRGTNLGTSLVASLHADTWTHCAKRFPDVQDHKPPFDKVLMARQVGRSSLNAHL